MRKLMVMVMVVLALSAIAAGIASADGKPILELQSAGPVQK